MRLLLLGQLVALQTLAGQLANLDRQRRRPLAAVAAAVLAGKQLGSVKASSLQQQQQHQTPGLTTSSLLPAGGSSI
jgi:hypothetical protein